MVKQPVHNTKSAEVSSGEGQGLAPTSVTKTSEFTFSPQAAGQRVLPKAPLLADETKQQLMRDTLANLQKLGYSATEVDLGKLNPPDLYEDELQVMAEVRAYFQVAYKVCRSTSACGIGATIPELMSDMEPGHFSASLTTCLSPSIINSCTRSSKSFSGSCLSAWVSAHHTPPLAALLTSPRTRPSLAPATN